MQNGGRSNAEEEQKVARIEAVTEGGHKVCKVEVDLERRAILHVVTESQAGPFVPVLAGSVQTLRCSILPRFNVHDAIPSMLAASLVDIVVSKTRHAC